MGGGVSKAAHELLRAELVTERQRASTALQRVEALKKELVAFDAAAASELEAARAAMLAGRPPAELQSMLDAMNAERDQLEERLRLEREARVEHLKRMAARRLGQKSLSRGWSTWHALHEHRQRIRRLLQIAAGRLARPALASAIAHWQHDWAESERLRIKQEESLRSAVEAELARAHAELEARNTAINALEARDVERVRLVEQRASRRLMRLGLARGWDAWFDMYAYVQATTQLLRVAGGRLRRPRLSTAVMWWVREWRLASETREGQLEHHAREWARAMVTMGLVESELDALEASAHMLSPPTELLEPVPSLERMVLAGGDTESSRRQGRHAPTLMRRTAPDRHAAAMASAHAGSSSVPELGVRAVPELGVSPYLTPPHRPPPRLGMGARAGGGLIADDLADDLRPTLRAPPTHHHHGHGAPEGHVDHQRARGSSSMVGRPETSNEGSMLSAGSGEPMVFFPSFSHGFSVQALDPQSTQSRPPRKPHDLTHGRRSSSGAGAAPDSVVANDSTTAEAEGDIRARAAQEHGVAGLRMGHAVGRTTTTTAADRLEDAERRSERLSERLQLTVASATSRVAHAEARAARAEADAGGAWARGKLLERQVHTMRRQLDAHRREQRRGVASQVSTTFPVGHAHASSAGALGRQTVYSGDDAGILAAMLLPARGSDV